MGKIMNLLNQSIAITFLACLICLSATKQVWADVYIYTDSGGVVNLSNQPSSDQYHVLIEDPVIRPQIIPPAPKVIRDKPLTMAEKRVKYKPIVDKAARASGVESALLHAVISVESRYNASAVSKKGATGMMQLMPATAERYGVSDSFDPEQNIMGGARYLRDLMILYHNDVPLALAAYNAGENTIARYGNRIPPLNETRQYVPKIMGYYRKYRINP